MEERRESADFARAERAWPGTEKEARRAAEKASRPPYWEFQEPERLDIYDLRRAPGEVQLSATTLAGLINRPRPRVYLLYSGDDDFWREAALSGIAQEWPPIYEGDILCSMLARYRERVGGMIIYDPAFRDSVNIATTLAGQRGGIVVSPRQAQRLATAYELPVLEDLRAYRWRSRLQAYTWAQQHLLAGSARHLLAGLDPRINGGLRSFLVATGAFVYWLDARDIIPDPTQGWRSERGLMHQIFDAFAPGSLHLGWFIDEGSGVCLASRGGKAVLASDHFFNLEVWASVAPPPTGDADALKRVPAHKCGETSISSKEDGLPPPSSCSVPPPLSNAHFVEDNPSPASLASVPPGSLRAPQEERAAASLSPEVYVSFTISDGDNLQYNQHRLLHLWNDPARGSLPIGWTISPLLMRAAPALAAHYLRTATANDELIAGPCGAGYIFPSRWPNALLPAYLEESRQLLEEMNVRTLQVLDGGLLQCAGLSFLEWLKGGFMQFRNRRLQREFVRALAPAGLRGILSGAGGRRPIYTRCAGVPVYQNLGLAGSVGQTLALIRRAAAVSRERPLFLNIYILAWSMRPSDLLEVVQQLGSGYRIVTPGRLLEMIAEVS